MKRDTVEWLKSLPSPDDDEGWRKRMDDKLHSILFRAAEAVAPVEVGEAENESRDPLRAPAKTPRLRHRPASRPRDAHVNEIGRLTNREQLRPRGDAGRAA
jgi:hypothetical protein